MIAVRSALGDDVDRSSHALAELRAGVAGLNAELLHGVGEGKWQIVVLKIILIIAAIECERKIVLTGSVHGKAAGRESHFSPIACRRPLQRPIGFRGPGTPGPRDPGHSVAD